MKSKMILDRIPDQFCEGPFWGNRKMGAVLYIRDGRLRVSIDHVGLWELRETLPDEPRATFSENLQNKAAYLSGDPDYVAETDIFKEHIGRTRLPALVVELSPDTNAGESSDAFTLESGFFTGFFIPTAMCEMFVHRAGADVWMLMGICDEWKACSCENLTVEGGHRISIRQEDYRIRRAVIKAACDERLVFHWKDNLPVKKLLKNGEEIPCPEGDCAVFVCQGEEWGLEF